MYCLRYLLDDVQCSARWPWDDRGRSSIPAETIAREAEHGKLLYLLAISQPDTRRTPLPTLNYLEPT